MNKLHFITLFLLTAATNCFGQLVATTNTNGNQLAQALAGNGVTISNVVFTGPAGSAGIFNATNSNLGMNSGIVLTTGSDTMVQGPNNHNAQGYDHLAAGNSLLNGLANDITYDACVLEFDMNILSDSVEFKYIFGSEEYPEWVTASYNDAFAFFISGPGINGQENIALVPGTTNPVTIHNINANNNSQYYHANGDGYTAPFNSTGYYVQYDGLTTLLTAKKKGLQPCNTYHLKLMIADAGDGIYDSGVFLQANSLTSNFVSIDDSAGTNIPNAPIAAEGCSNASIRFRLQNPVAQNTVVHYLIGGSAVNGVDYTAIPDSIVIPAGSTSAAITIAPIQDGITENIESVTVKLYSACSSTPYDSARVFISDSSFLTLSAGADQSICAGDQAQLTATGAGYINWAAAASLTANGTSATAAPLATTNYIATSQVGTCTLQDAVRVTVTSAPFSVNAGNDITACSGATVQLNATVTGNTVNGNAFTYTWAPAASLSANNIANPTTTATSSANYIIQVASGNCKATDTVAVNIGNGNVTATATATSETCFGYNNGSATVTANGTSPLTFHWSNNATTQSITGLAGGNYQVTITDNTGCSATTAVSVATTTAIHFSNPTITPVKCYGDANGMVNLTAAGGAGNFTYVWSNGNNGATAGNLSANTAYTISATDANACVADTTIMLPAPAQINVTVAATNVSCGLGGTGNTVNPNAGRDGAARASANGGTAPYTFVWNTNVPATTADITNLTAGTYNVTVADANNCSASGSTSITEPQPMSITAASLAPACGNNATGTINANCTGGTGTHFFALAFNNTTIASNNMGAFSNLTAGDYVISVTDANNCVKTANLNLAAATADEFTINTTGVSCHGGDNGTITVIPVNVLNQPYTYVLDNGTSQALNEFTKVNGGTHNLHITSNGGCVTDTTVTIAEPAAAVLAIVPGDTTMELGGTLQLNTSLSAFNTDSAVLYNWSANEGMSCADCANPVVNTYAKSTEYSVTVTYNGSCKAVATAKVDVKGNNVAPFVPNAFTPNGDGNNDVFMVFGQGISKIDMQIFNRWGERVFQSNNQYDGWDGTFKGQLQNTDVFVYQVTATYLDGRTVDTNGTVTLLR
jgi:gliding motility-associated-like protein